MEYDNLELIEPIESDEYYEVSQYIVSFINDIMNTVIKTGHNKIILNTNLKRGLPMENINKLAGPIVESWAQEVFMDVLNKKYGGNNYCLESVRDGERLNMADIILTFNFGKKVPFIVQANVDVKATARDIKSSGKSPNITSFGRIRTAYTRNPNYIFIILSLKHRVYSVKDDKTGLVNGVMEVTDFNAYDLKYIADADLSYNPALGTGQIQIRDIHHVNFERRSTLEFCKMLDRKFLNSKKGYDEWYLLAQQNGWIK